MAEALPLRFSHRRICLSALLIASLLLATTAGAQSGLPVAGAARPAAEVRAFRASTPIRIDGRLDEPDWQRPSAAPLIQNDPDNGRAPRQRTDWWVVYDDEALYLAARLWDTAPDSIVGRLGRRDSYPASDFLVVCLDTFNDDRNGYLFSVNASGVIGDASLYNDGADDPSWDPVWDVATRIDDRGWTMEMRLPFSQLNFPDRAEQRWGINFSRRDLRSQERDDLYHRPRGASGVIRRYPDLVGIAGIAPSSRRELLAYGAGRAEYLQHDPSDPFNDGSRYRSDLGADLKWGLTNQITLNATVNPDFGQVEVDPAVVNLSDFETFFEERRPFFVEQANVFRYGREGTSSSWNFNSSDPMPFYSRRIGRAPQLALGEHDFADVPGSTTILGAGKLSGKVGRTELGLLTAVTARERADLLRDGTPGVQTVEPGTGYAVLRLKRADDDGRRGLGGMFTGVARDLGDPAARAGLTRQAWSGGLDGWTALNDARTWAVRGYLDASHVQGSTEALNSLQRNSRHYYQRPDAPQLDYDPTRTSLTGWCGRVMLNRESGRFTLNTALGATSPGFEISDVGYQGRADNLNWHLATGYHWLQPTRTFRNCGFDLAAWRAWDFGGTPDDSGYGLFWSSQFANYWYLETRLFYNPERNSLRATRGGPILRLADSREWSGWLATDGRRSLGAEAEWDVTSAGDGSDGYYVTTRLEWRPGSALRLACGPAVSWNHTAAMWVDRRDDPLMTATGGARYLFADFDYREFSLVTRIDWTFTPRLTLQSYLQPLFAAGHYRGLMEFARPGTREFNRYGQDNGSTVAYDPSARVYTIDPDGPGPAAPFALDDPDFNFKSLKANVVLRWEYRPGSTAYLVWTQDRVDFDDPGDFHLGRDTRSLLDAPGDHIVMLKITNWFRI